MRSTDRERHEIALDRLSRLACALTRVGLTAELVPNRRPFPGLAIRLPPGAATHIDAPRPNDVIRIPAGAVMVLAGSAHYWCQRPSGDLQLVGPLAEPVQAAQKILDRLSPQIGYQQKAPHVPPRRQR